MSIVLWIIDKESFGEMFVQKKKLVEHVLAMRAEGGSSDDDDEEEDQGDILQVQIPNH
ncbi:GD20774 [Drosophila simulans]|uniref:GD20774 n=1 Tax=Drosophila simulans TaxID=7240 RepID=B4QWI4_DROSI|nr:GD20774 [Drosophila simulans]